MRYLVQIKPKEFQGLMVPAANAMMQYPFYSSYPYTNAHLCFNNSLSSVCVFGQAYGNSYAYQPWMTLQGNPRIVQQHRKSDSSVVNSNMYYPSCPQISPPYVKPHYSFYHHPWNTPYALTAWFNHQKMHDQMNPWSSYYDKWTPMKMNLNANMYYSWPMMSFYSNQIMYPNYIYPSPIYWGVQDAVEVPYFESNQKEANHNSSESAKLNVTSSDVIREFNLPPAVAKKTRSDIPIQSSDFSDIKSSEYSKEEMELPYLFRVSDTSIKQIASSRSFGPSMVYTTESDNKPLSARW